MLQENQLAKSISQSNDEVFRILEMGDIHVNHHFVSHTSIIELISSVLLNSSVLEKTNRIYLAGDFYDHGMEYTDIDLVLDIEEFQKRFLEKCKEHDVQVRILAGTRSHDRGQPIHFVKINEACNIGCDLKYFDKLTVEIDERYGDSTLYIPDQWNVDATKTLKEAVAEMKKLGLGKVDYGCMHGSFKYQMLPHLRTKQDLHDEEQYVKLIKHVLFVGHHHNSSNYENIWCAGSPQRLRFGEEEDKGYLTAEIYKDLPAVVRFHVLDDAKPMITIDCAGMNAEDSMKVIDPLVARYPDDLGLRIIGHGDDPAAELVRRYNDEYPHLHFKFEKKGQKEKKQLPTIDIAESIKHVKALTKENIAELLANRMVDKHPDYAPHVKRVMDEVLDEIAS